jgi:flagella basal body P-ring formation protein FlgA
VWLLAAQCAEATVLKFKKTAAVSHSVVTLGDIAEVLDPDPRTIEKLNQLMISPAPSPKRAMRLELATVRSRLQASGVNLLKTEFTGSSVITVSRSDGQARNGNPFQRPFDKIAKHKRDRAQRLVSDAVRQYLARVAPELGEVDVVVDVPREEVELLLTGFVTGYDVRGGSAPWLNPQVFEILFLDRSETVKRVRVQCAIRPRPRVIAVSHTVPRGHVLRPNDLIWQQTAAEESGFTRVEDVINKETTRTLRKHQTVQADDVRSIPLVRSNDIVTVISRSPGVTVQRELKARSDGAMGETVTLFSLNGKQMLMARVTGIRQAEVLGSDAPAGQIRPVGNQRVVLPQGVQQAVLQEPRVMNAGRFSRAGPIGGAPVRGAPVRGAPVRGAPVRGAPVRRAPVQSGQSRTFRR